MATPKLLLDSVGSWAGESELHLPWLPEDQRVAKSPSTLQIESDQNNAFASLRYTWVYEGEDQAGALLVAANDANEATGGWSDSWHQSGAVMALKGEAGDTVDLLGSYQVEGHPDWGWRIRFQSAEGGLQVEMFNISPEGEESLAVQGSYRKS